MNGVLVVIQSTCFLSHTMQGIDIVVIIILPSQLAIREIMIIQDVERTLFMNLFSSKKQK